VEIGADPVSCRAAAPPLATRGLSTTCCTTTIAPSSFRPPSPTPPHRLRRHASAPLCWKRFDTRRVRCRGDANALDAQRNRRSVFHRHDEGVAVRPPRRTSRETWRSRSAFARVTRTCESVAGGNPSTSTQYPGPDQMRCTGASRCQTPTRSASPQCGRWRGATCMARALDPFPQQRHRRHFGYVGPPHATRDRRPCRPRKHAAAHAGRRARSLCDMRPFASWVVQRIENGMRISSRADTSANELQELRPGRCIVAEAAEHHRGFHYRVLLSTPASPCTSDALR
jgi:hypothetical protein